MTHVLMFTGVWRWKCLCTYVTSVGNSSTVLTVMLIPISSFMMEKESVPSFNYPRLFKALGGMAVSLGLSMDYL